MKALAARCMTPATALGIGARAVSPAFSHHSSNWSARAGKRLRGPLSALRAHTKIAIERGFTTGRAWTSSHGTRAARAEGRGAAVVAVHRPAQDAGEVLLAPPPGLGLADGPQHLEMHLLTPHAAHHIKRVIRERWPAAPSRARPARARRCYSCRCPGQKSPFLAVKRPARPYKSAIENRFTWEYAKGAKPPPAARTEPEGIGQSVASPAGEAAG